MIGFARAQAVHDSMEPPNTDACEPCQDNDCPDPCSGSCCDNCLHSSGQTELEERADAFRKEKHDV